jgi:hypothetical protein
MNEENKDTLGTFRYMINEIIKTLRSNNISLNDAVHPTKNLFFNFNFFFLKYFFATIFNR